MGRDTPNIDPMAGYKPLPHQQRFHESKARWRLMSAGFGCVAAGTLIHNPDTGHHEPVETLTAPGVVATITGKAARTAAFKKGHGALYTVTTCCGNAITVAASHKFLTPWGWVPLTDIKLGDPVAVAHPPHACGRHCQGTTQGSRCGCPPHHRCGDARLPGETSTGRGDVPSPADALARTRCTNCGDVLEHGQAHTHVCPACGHPSNPGAPRRDEHPGVQAATPLHAASGTRNSPTTPTSGRSQRGSSRTPAPAPHTNQDPTGDAPCRCGSGCRDADHASVPAGNPPPGGGAATCCDRHQGHGRSTVDPHLPTSDVPHPESRSASWACVSKVDYVGDGDIWDIHVPVEHHYSADGFYNANSGKTVPLCREALWTALAYPNSFGLILRKEQRPLTQSTWRTFQQMLNETGLKPPLVKVTGGSDNIPPTVQFSPQVGGSLIKFHNCGNPDNFRGYEPDWIAFDEGSEIPDSIYSILRGRLRGTKNPNGRVEYEQTDPTTGEVIRTRVSGPLRAWIATNPGPSNWIRQNFRPPGVPGEPAPGFETIAASTADNPYLPPSYIEEMLAEYPEGPRRQMFLDGNWGVFEGQVFTEFNPDKHWTQDATAHDLVGWRIIEGWDFGRANETAVVWIAYDENWRYPIRVLDQYAAKERVPSEHAKTVKERRNMLGITELTCVGDPAGAQRGASGSYFEEYARQHIYIAPSTKARSLQIRDERLHQLLATTYPDGTPLIQFCHRAKHLVGDMLALQYKDWNESTNRDRPDERKKKQDHTVDALQYALMILPPPHAIRTNAGNRLRDGIGAAAGMLNPWE